MEIQLKVIHVLYLWRFPLVTHLLFGERLQALDDEVPTPAVSEASELEDEAFTQDICIYAGNQRSK